MYRACSINIKCTAIVREPGQSQVSLLEERRGEKKGKKKEKKKKKKQSPASEALRCGMSAFPIVDSNDRIIIVAIVARSDRGANDELFLSGGMQS